MQMVECDDYQPGDLVHLQGVAGHVKEIPLVIKRKSDLPTGQYAHLQQAVFYDVRMLEDDLSGYKKDYSLFARVMTTEIAEGPCRSPDTPRWELSPEKAAAIAAKIAMRTSPPAPAVVDTAPSDFLHFSGIVDRLLGELPEKRVEEFAKTQEMVLYTKVIKGNYTEAERKHFIEVVDTLLGELPEKIVVEFLKSADYQTYDRVVKAAKK
jgi:hypothetical protein